MRFIDEKLNDEFDRFLETQPTSVEIHMKLIDMVNRVTDERDFYKEREIRKGGQPSLPHCPNCGSYNYEVGFHSSAHNCKCRDCGTLFFWNFNI